MCGLVSGDSNGTQKKRKKRKAKGLDLAILCMGFLLHRLLHHLRALVPLSLRCSRKLLSSFLPFLLLLLLLLPLPLPPLLLLLLLILLLLASLPSFCFGARSTSTSRAPAPTLPRPEFSLSHPSFLSLLFPLSMLLSSSLLPPLCARTTTSVG